MDMRPIMAITSLVSLIRLEVEHFKAYSFDQDGASGRCRRRCAGTTDAPLESPGALCPPNRGTSRATVRDLRLRGDSGVRHQIDAVVGDGHKRILVETKDYDKVRGLPIIRNFWGAVEDI